MDDPHAQADSEPASSLLSGASCPSTTACEAVESYGTASGTETLAEAYAGAHAASWTTPNEPPQSRRSRFATGLQHPLPIIATRTLR